MNSNIIGIMGMVGIFLLICIVIYIVYRASEKKKQERTESMFQLAQDLEFSFQDKEHNTGDFVNKYSYFSMLQKGREKKSYNILVRQDEEYTTTLFDYSYLTGRGKNKKRHTTTNIIIKHSNESIPHFFMRHEIAFIDFLGKMIGGQDINFDDDKEFSKSFVLQSEDEEAARAYFEDPNIRALFLCFQNRPLHIEAKANHIIFAYNIQVAVDELESHMREAQNIIAALT
jgi:cbb3-type cytochrome oxidase subunit 3